ncbi:Retrovirus-related Pol polyprotein, partial [Mucuna pruriens]
MMHPIEDHSLFGVYIIDELVEECMQLDTGNVEISNFVELIDVTDYFNFVMDVSDSVNMIFLTPWIILPTLNAGVMETWSVPVPLSDHLKYAYLDDHQHFLQEEKLLNVLRKYKRQLGRRRSLTDKAAVETTEFDHPGCHQERSDKTICSRDHLSYLGQPMGQSGIGSFEEVRDDICIDYQKLNQPTRKDHFLLPFINQVLERLARKSHYCFLDGFSGYMQIHIVLADQHKSTFTCPFGTFAYTRMPFGLCNALSTFQRCMINIFLDLLEDWMEVFMDDFTVYAESFEACLENLSHVLTRCIETNLVLNFEKCHFMVIEGIVLEHLIFSRRIKVDKAKVNIITSLSNPAFVWEVHSFLGHVGFYRPFIKNFNKAALPLSKLLQKDVDFIYEQPCMEAFQELKKQLTSTSILQAPNWEYSFELMCDATNSTLGAVLG